MAGMEADRRFIYTRPRMTGVQEEPRSLLRGIAAGFLWVAAFSYACGIFFSLTMLVSSFPPTAPVAVGRVTIEHASKLKDYLTAFLFLLLTPLFTVWLHRQGARADAFYRRRLAWRLRPEGLLCVSTILFAGPFLLSPFFYLTTNKAGWIVLLPLLASQLGPNALYAIESRRWVRHIFSYELRPYQAAIAIEALAWICFRYIATGRRIAHIPTLFLESVFVAFFVAAFCGAMVLVSRVRSFTHGGSHERTLQRMAIAGMPFLVLPLMMVSLAHALPSMLVIFAIFLGAAALALRGEDQPDPARLRQLLVWAIVPALLYTVSYASTAALSQWIDLFHRGETLGPASDYLRGKAPYRQVFVLHGMLEDGVLDTWLMQLFGRNLDVALARPVILGSFLAPALWLLGIIVFDSIPMATLVVAIGSWTTAENDRTFFQIAVVTLLWYALRRRKSWPAFVSGVFAAVALFFSYEIGVYSIAGGLASIAAIAVATRMAWDGLPFRRAALLFTSGILAGSTPFLIYLGLHGSLAAFAETSFVTIPHIIDAIWSLPFPDLVSTFRSDLNLHSISDFILFEKFHLVLSFLTIAIAAVYLIQRWMRRAIDDFDLALLVLVIFAAVTQRSALGRAEFRHQYFSAFLIGPILVMLVTLLVRRSRVWWRAGDDGTRAFVVTVAFAATILAAVLLWIPDLINARIDDVLRYLPRVSRTFYDPTADRVHDRIIATAVAIDDMTKPNEPIFDFSNQPALYFFANRPNPTRFYQVPILSPPAFQAETIKALELSRARVVIIGSPEGFDTFDGVPNALRAQAVAAYIADHYAFTRNIRGIELWSRRNDIRGALNLKRYLRLIHIPSATDINESGKAREIFPSVGSTPGIDAYWRSDLVIHNPFPEPMTLRLRYASEQRKEDRTVTIGGGRTEQWKDVVASFFGAPETFGTLWLEHRADRKPVCRVRTYDSLHVSRGTLFTPLSIADAANADTLVKDLTLVGLNGSAGRRINIGVVDVGVDPASFRISARNRLGKSVGRTVTSSVEEDSSYLRVDIASVLGIPIDESMSIVVEVTHGTAIAYGSVTDPATHDTQVIAAIPSLHP